MNESKSEPELNLEKPGAGLPFFEWAIANYVIVPYSYHTIDEKQASTYFTKEADKILALARGLKPEKLSERVLIPRLRGMEDSSRYWSVAMTMQHLVIVGGSIRKVIIDLSNGGTKLQPTGTAAVKPNPDVDRETIIASFQEMAERFVRDTANINVNAFPKATFPHPWFGPLNAKGWLILAASHQRIHRHQTEEIVSRLSV